MPTPNMAATTTVTPKILSSGLVAAGNASIYVVGANKASKISKLILCNISSAAVTLSVSLVPAGQLVDGTHRVVHNYSLMASDTLVIEEFEGMWLGDSDRIVVSAATGDAIVATLNGLEFS